MCATKFKLAFVAEQKVNPLLEITALANGRDWLRRWLRLIRDSIRREDEQLFAIIRLVEVCSRAQLQILATVVVLILKLQRLVL